MSNNKLLQRWLVALLLALGLGTIWGLLIALGGSVLSALAPSESKTAESLERTVDGQLLIYARIGGNYLHTELSTLDGQKVDEDRVQFLGGTGTHRPYRPPGLLEFPVLWRERLAGVSDYARPPTEWVFIRNAEPTGSAYLAGFDVLSKLPIGFIGREGFRQTTPPRDQWFDIGPYRLDWQGSSIIASTGRIRFGGRAYVDTATGPIGDQQLAPWLVYLIEEGKTIREINLREKTVRKVVDLDDLVSISVTNVRVPKSEGRETQDVSVVDRILARCNDRLVLVNPFDGALVTFPLPEELQNANFGVWVVAEDELVLKVYRGYWQRGNVVDVIGLNTIGEIDRGPTVRLASYVPGNPRIASLSLAAVGPSPVAWLAGVGVAGPCEKLQHRRADSYLAALRATIAEYWPGMLITIVVAILSAWLVLRSQKRYCRPNTRLWWLTTLVTGIPGLMAYWTMHRRPPMAACEACGQRVPRNRDACPDCQQPFAEPALHGTEIFA